ncbi:MAG: 50S ribosomal protein L32 [Candidatus Buchananbacteria bacterium]|nr:50S ribosomal protein L32 [Candidatus Buchananbacteria bacterium]
MGLPSKRRTKSQGLRRASHFAIKPTKGLVTCPNCEAKIPAHRACPKCGQYRGRQTVAVKKPAAARKTKSQSKSK